MSTIKIEVDDSKVDIVLNIIKNLKENIVSKYEVVSDTTEQKDFIRLSQKPLKKIWDNKEDSDYDRFLQA
jgi:hypothetical protein